MFCRGHAKTLRRATCFFGLRTDAIGRSACSEKHRRGESS